jgi:hypothetical protein
MVEASGRHLGVATIGELADYYRILRKDVLAVVAETRLIPVEVLGWPAAAWADPVVLDSASAPGSRHKTTLLSPFDSLIWDRARTERVFGFVHRLEAYVPPPKRVHGYYAMPVLAGGRLVGRVDPGRKDGALVAKKVTLGSASVAGSVATALARAARWISAESVVVLEVDPPEAASRLRSAVSQAIGDLR